MLKRINHLIVSKVLLAWRFATNRRPLCHKPPSLREYNDAIGVGVGGYWWICGIKMWNCHILLFCCLWRNTSAALYNICGDTKERGASVDSSHLYWNCGAFLPWIRQGCIDWIKAMEVRLLIFSVKLYNSWYRLWIRIHISVIVWRVNMQYLSYNFDLWIKVVDMIWILAINMINYDKKDDNFLLFLYSSTKNILKSLIFYFKYQQSLYF